MQMKKLFLTAAILIGWTSTVQPWFWQEELRWDWRKIDLSDQTFWQQLTVPQGFLWGAATSAIQIEGTVTANGKHCQNSWTQDTTKHQPGVAADHWNRYKEDVQLIKEAGLNSYRLSVCWSKIEPECGVFDEDAMNHYADLIADLVNNGITPFVCLFHHEWPVWFDKLAAFEKEENIKYFVEYAEYVFRRLHEKVPYWMTFNEPVGYALEGYFRGKYPPNKKDMYLCGIVVKNMLNAHVEVYKRYQQIDNSAWVGLPKVFNPLDPYTPWSPIEKPACAFFSYLLHDVALNFFKTGTFSWPYHKKNKKGLFKHKLSFIKDYNKNAVGSLDYLGVNYYSHTVLRRPKGKLKPEAVLRKREQRDGIKRAIYPEGLYRAIEMAATVGVPLIIAENGIHDGGDKLKNEYIKKHLYVIQKAIKEGYKIFGYHMWTLIDGFSWSKGSDTHMGFYRNDRTMYNQVKPLVNFLNK